MQTTEAAAVKKSGITTRELVIDAMLIALTYIFTAFVNLRLPIAANGGLIHLGNVPLFLAAIIFLLSGWYLWAPFTFVIVGFMGFTVGAITEKHHGYGWNALAIAVACVIKVVGYYIAEGFIYGNWIAPATSIPGNLVQIGVAAIIVIPIAERLRITVQKRL